MNISKASKPEESVKKQFDLSNKVIIITGGAGFLGLHFAEAIAEMGGFPILLDMDQNKIEKGVEYLKDYGYQSDGFVLDLTDRSQVLDIVSQIVDLHHKIDVLVNAAAFAMQNMKDEGDQFFAPFEDYDIEQWDKMLKVNLTGTFLITQAIGSEMKKQEKGIVINIASDLALISPDQRIYEPDERFDYKGVSFNTPIGYPTTKAGILGFTRYLATYWAPYGIRVNALSPAGVYREQDLKFVEQLSYRIPLGRMAFPEELKGPIVFLCSDASSYMTGSNLIVDGGRTIW